MHNTPNLTSNRFAGMVTISVAMLLIVVILTAPGCSRAPMDEADSIRLRSFLEVTYPGDSWSISDNPSAKVTNIGPAAAEVQVFRFTLVADDDVDMAVPENCNLTYENNPEEMLLIVHCMDFWLEQNESLTMAFPLTGPWHYLELTSIYSRDAQGNEVHNNISTSQPLMWFNQYY